MLRVERLTKVYRRGVLKRVPTFSLEADFEIPAPAIVGLLAVEMFLKSDGELVVNELAPRPHNSGHWTIEGCGTSQFEQHVRAVCGLSLGATELLRPSAMVNLLGDLWSSGEPNWPAALSEPNIHLHLYGKRQPRPGRKMGHLTALADSIEEAEASAIRARARLVEA